VETHPSLVRGGKLCACASELENNPSDIRLFNLAFTSDRPGGAGSRDIYLYDREATALVPLPGVNQVGIEQTPALSPDGRYLVFAAERASGMGERDVYLYDRRSPSLVPTPALNTKGEDFDPVITYRGE